MGQDRGTASISVRKATFDDLGVIKSFYAQLSPDVSNLDRDFPSMLGDPNAICLVLQQVDKPIGMATCYVRQSLSLGAKMVIDEVIVDQAYLRAGLGCMLVEHCLGLGKARKVDCFEVCCSMTKPELHRFYEKAGFLHRMKQYSLFPEDHRQDSGV